MKLTYRGHTYDYNPRPAVISEVAATDRETVTLMYRGTAYKRTPPSPKSYQQSRAINWRYQTLEEG